jgi:hypothetical protein
MILYTSEKIIPRGFYREEISIWKTHLMPYSGRQMCRFSIFSRTICEQLDIQFKLFAVQEPVQQGAQGRRLLQIVG